MEMTYESFLDSISHQTGVESAQRAEEMACGVLCVLGEVLLDSDRQALADELSPPLRRALCSRKPNQNYQLAQFYERIDAEEQLGAGRAREVAQIVGQTLARAVDPELVKRFRRRLPGEYEAVFVNPRVDVNPPEPRLDHSARASERTLSRAKSGSEKPLSEARPAEGHRGSVAAQENPYEETKLSTGHESTDEDEQTLAGGKPGSDRPVSDTHEE